MFALNSMRLEARQILAIYEITGTLTYPGYSFRFFLELSRQQYFFLNENISVKYDSNEWNE